ncbi:hypothetical protein [Halobacillus dabanensis]|uniref:hypothetical protein n=1 Tax=Halobacillus dabanensis TaxID=240302 RepID=UPI0011143424
MTVESDKPFYSYWEGILKQWEQAGVRALKAAKQAKKEYKKTSLGRGHFVKFLVYQGYIRTRHVKC